MIIVDLHEIINQYDTDLLKLYGPGVLNVKDLVNLVFSGIWRESHFKHMYRARPDFDQIEDAWESMIVDIDEHISSLLRIEFDSCLYRLVLWLNHTTIYIAKTEYITD